MWGANPSLPPSLPSFTTVITTYLTKLPVFLDHARASLPAPPTLPFPPLLLPSPSVGKNSTWSLGGGRGRADEEFRNNLSRWDFVCVLFVGGGGGWDRRSNTFPQFHPHIITFLLTFNTWPRILPSRTISSHLLLFPFLQYCTALDGKRTVPIS